ncbi:MAG: NAD(P)H-hydrate dehydratase [Microscillaceae bacterium]|nr:NAD(P)H-hydrate dehydratase [Microscillaceae bacterium]MDW8460291.1 NAD(P)H-hydrate dehydratase [Cytophagales bacterium]
MLKILSATQIKTLDQYTIAHEPIASIDLMERACMQVTQWLRQNFSSKQPFHIFCGVGNNGGDGLGIARQLIQLGYNVNVWVVWQHPKRSEDFQQNLNRLEKLTEVKHIYQAEQLPSNLSKGVLVDAILGTGINREPEGITAEVIRFIQNQYATQIVVSIDVPSGLLIDQPTAHTTIVKAHHTLTFQVPKLAFFMPENEVFVGNWHVLNIQLSAEKLEETPTQFYFIEAQDLVKIRKRRSKFAHKGTFGRALLQVGSYGKIGAAILAAKACLRSGVGLLTLHIPQCGYTALQTAIPEAMVEADKNETHLTAWANDLTMFNSIGLGCGMGMHLHTKAVLENTLTNFTKPIVLDADALNILAQNPELLAQLPKNSILTPHRKEFQRLAKVETTQTYSLWLAAQEFAKQYQVFLVLKGHYTAIITPEQEIYFNSTGNAGMATAGSGDVLTGILTSLLAQGYTAYETCLLGVYLHGLAGDLAIQQAQSVESLIASDLIEQLGKAFQKL